jgi:hypothetical protein
MQKTFCAAENTACYLPFANTFCPLVGRTIEPAAVKTDKAASIYVGIVTAAKIPTSSVIRFIGDNASCRHFDATSDKEPKPA